MFSSVFCSLLGFISDDYYFVVAIRHLPLNMDIYLYISMYIQAEYRRFGVFNFLILITVPVISFLLCRVVYYGCGWPRSFCLFPPDGVHIIYNYGFHGLLIIYPPLTAYIGYLHLPAHASIGVVLLYIFIGIFLFVTLLPFFPLVTSLNLAKV